MHITDPPAELSPELTMLGTTEYPVYLYRGETESAIFEGGVGAMGPVLRQQIEDSGVDAASVKQLIVTHGHPDHVMAVPMFRELFPNVSVCASAGAAATLSNEKALAFFAKIDDALTGALLQSGSIEEQHRPAPLNDTEIAIDRILAAGDVVEVGDARFDVLETPGHSDCSLSFHDPASGILIVADATGHYLADSREWWPMYFTSYGSFVDSIARLATLKAEILCLSHNAAIRGAAEIEQYFRGALASAEAYHQRIVDETRGGTSASDLVARLGAEIHEQTPLLPLDFFEKNCALLVKNSLAHEGIGE